MKDGAGYTLFWSEKNKDEHTSIARKLQNLPTGHSDRFMSLRRPNQDNKFATIVSVYASILQAEIEVQEAFYRDLHNLLQQLNSTQKVNLSS